MYLWYYAALFTQYLTLIFFEPYYVNYECKLRVRHRIVYHLYHIPIFSQSSLLLLCLIETAVLSVAPLTARLTSHLSYNPLFWNIWITMNKRDRMIACEMIRQGFVKTGKYQNWRNQHSQDFEFRSETALDVKELFDSRLPKVINKVNSHFLFENLIPWYTYFYLRIFSPSCHYPLLRGENNILTEILCPWQIPTLV